MKVYHGSIQEIRFPLAKAGRPNLDFGRGFYVTDIRRQAEEWAERIGLRMVETPMLNIYELDMDLVRSKFRVLKFEDYNKEWLAQGGLSVAGRCRCLTKDSNTSIEKEGYIPYSLQA